MIDQPTIDRILDAANIVDVVSEFVTLRKRGVNYVGLCPFHDDRSPSFYVSPAKNICKCFACGEGGTAVHFIMKHEQLNYYDALRYLARKYNIEIQERELTEREKRIKSDRESMLIVNEWAQKYFTTQLYQTIEGKAIGLRYFAERGFREDTIRKFQLGYNPDQYDALYQAAIQKGFKKEYLEKTGLVFAREDGSVGDRFRGRVMFPVHSLSGKVVAFGGRVLKKSEKTAKYVNSPESEIYHKSNELYGIYFAKKAIVKADRCFLVEGYTDVISMHQAGVENVVASSGTSLTVEQIQLIKRFTRNVTVIYDGDSAGIKASLRGIDMILREGLNVRVVRLPEEDDPDTFARSHTSEELREYIRTNERDFISFKAELLMGEATGDPIKRAGLITEMVSSIAQIPDPIPRAVYVKECAEMMGIDEQVLLGEVARRRLRPEENREASEFIRRQQRLMREQQQATVTEPSATLSTVDGGSGMEALERELSKYLIKYGHCNFDYREGRGEVVSINVADTIISELNRNGLEFVNPVYHEILRTYKQLHEELGSGVEVPQHYFVNHSDPAVCTAAVDLLTSEDNYVASRLWELHDVNVTSEQERLSVAVSRAIILYKAAAIKKIISDLTDELKREDLDEEAQAAILHNISLLNDERRIISDRLDRTVL